MNLAPLLALIRRAESRGDYNIVWGRIAPRDRPPAPLVTMTIAEVLAWQDRIDPFYQSEAAGAYQIMEDTLRGLYRETGLSATDRFDEDNQDRLAVQLLRRRGLDHFLAGDIGATKFANAIAREWASFPVVGGPRDGRSYYAGDGLNKALVKPAEVLAAVAAIKTCAPTQP